MSVYTVHAPPSAAAAPDPERFVFVRDGFHFWGFVFGPVWLLCRGLWLVFVIYIAVVAALHGALWLLAVPSASQAMLTFLAHLLVGLEAGTIQRWTFKQRRWSPVGVVTGANREAAERRFYDRWTARDARRQPPPVPPLSPPKPSAPPPMRPPEPPSDIIGLFPEPQSRP